MFTPIPHPLIYRKLKLLDTIEFFKVNFYKQSFAMFAHAKNLVVSVGSVNNNGLERLSESQAAFAKAQAAIKEMESVLETLQALQQEHLDTDVVTPENRGVCVCGKGEGIATSTVIVDVLVAPNLLYQYLECPP